ncbi:XRE family transcriptional regulator, partial (plasmid) [Rickettsia amblyommatis]
FFHCPIDEVIGRKQYILFNEQQQQFLQLSLHEIQKNLISFIKSKLVLEKITAYQLAKKLKLGETVIHDFIKDGSNINILSSPVIIKLANYYCISLDIMIKRTIVSN